MTNMNCIPPSLIAGSCRSPEYWNAESAAGGAQFLVERGERQRGAIGKLQIGGGVEGQAEPVGKLQGRRPAVSVGMRVGRDVEQRKIGKCGIAERHIDTAPANRGRQAVGDFETPKCGCVRTIFRDALKYL